MERLEVEAALERVGHDATADSLESETLDFKLVADSVKATHNLLADALVCFVNARGGTVILGVALTALPPPGHQVNLLEPGAPIVSSPAQEHEQVRAGRLAKRTRERHAAVHDLLARGKDLRAIAAELGLARNTVRRFARAASPDELLVNAGTGRRPKALDAFEPYLRRRWNDGCTNAEQLYQELRALGYRGRPTTVRQYLHPWRSAAVKHPPSSPPPTVRQAAGWLLRDPAHLTDDEQRRLEALSHACPPLAALRDHVGAFARMMVERRGDLLERWMTTVDDSLPELRSFVAGLRRDFDAVRAGLTLPHSSGPVEGHVNRVKMLKRQMYGRANPDLLRKRVLLA
ncbi:transposase [Nonomuraea africana]|uniref:transposase n=1 Tax=Nonomuraea africana TaxID=46171 RepID=UPI0033C6877C